MEPIDNDLTGLIKAVSTGSLSRTDVTDAYIRRLELVEPKVNGLAQSDLNGVRDATEAMDRSGTTGPLMGLPFMIKDCLEVKNWITTFGTQGFADHVSDYSATIVRRLEAAEGLLLGITNAPELGTSIETDNLLYGRSNNPIDLARTPGGSTGGGAALVKAKAVPFVIGSDFGGGSRNAAHCCGLFAHRPSYGRVSTAGYLFGCSGLKGKMCRLAPLARSVRDLELIFGIIEGEDPDDPKTGGVYGSVSHRAPEDLRIALVTGSDVAPPETEIVCAIEAFGNALQPSFHLDKLDLDPLFLEGNNVATALFTADAGRLLQNALQNVAKTTKTSVSMDFWLETVGNNREISAGDFIALLSRWEAFCLSFNRIFETYDILIIPTGPTSAPLHGKTLEQGFFWKSIAYTAPISLTEAPVLVVPIAVGAGGLPVSVQLVAKRGLDESLLAFGRLLQERPSAPREQIEHALAAPTVFDQP